LAVRPNVEQETLRSAVKDVFRGIREGRIVLTDAVPQTRQALAAVRFTKQGNPIMRTVSAPVRALAWGVAGVGQRKPSQSEIKAARTPTTLPEWLPKPVVVTSDVLAKASRQGTHLEVALDLYKEAGTLVTLCAAAFVGDDPSVMTVPRNRAIVGALLARIAKFMAGVLHLGRTGQFGEVVAALNRSIMESAVDVMYLCQPDNAEDRFRRFVADGLSAERALFDRVNENVAARGHRLPIEERLLAGVDGIFRASGLTIDEVKPTARPLDLASRLRALGRESDYLFVQRIPSAAVHGTWLDLLHHHIREVEGGFSVRFSPSPMDVRLLVPLGIIVLEAAETFVKRHLSAAPEAGLLRTALLDLRGRLILVDRSHEEWFQRMKGQRKATGAK
jgi:hypothetical protein